MSQTSEQLTFTVPLSFEAHALAQEFRRLQSSSQKAKQIYLNTLAVYAVDHYLHCLGFETDVKQSDSRNPVYLKIMDVADLWVKQLGRLECRPVLPESQVCQIPPDAWSDRIGYIAVQMSQSLKQATLLGFTQTAAAEIPLSQLRSLTELPEYLNQIRQPVAVNLQAWLRGFVETSWQTVEAVLGQNQLSLAPVRQVDSLQPTINRAKLIDLGMQLGEQAVVLAIAVAQVSHEKVKVSFQVRPRSGETYLPANLRLVMLSESNEVIQEVQSRSQDNYIQLRRFDGQPGDQFQIQIALNDVIVTESFIF